jgi:hypothetical protein
MTPSEWAREKINSLSIHVPVFWVQDPYCLLEKADLTALGEKAEKRGRVLITANNGFRLREQLLSRDPAGGGVIVVDQSCTPREPHLLPRDCKPHDFAPLAAPDWKAFLRLDALFCPTIRDFLIACTDDPRWPMEVNLYPYETLARRKPDRFVEAYQDFTRSGRPMTSEDLMMIGASAIFDENLMDLSNVLVAMGLAFHSPNKWKELAEYFNAGEIEAIRQRLTQNATPIGELFGSKAEQARLALTSLIVLRQHFEEPGKELGLPSPELISFQDCTVGLFTNAPAWFVEEEVPRFEPLLTPAFKKHLHVQLKLEDAQSAREFAGREHFSKELRALVPFERGAVAVSGMSGGRDEFSLPELVNAFMDAKRELAVICRVAKPLVERLKLTSVKEQSVAAVRDIFLEKNLCLADQLSGQLQEAILDVEGPARSRWQSLPWFEERWKSEANAARNLIELARGLGSDLDYRFGLMLENRYSQLAAGEVLSTNDFYSEFIGPRRRKNDGSLTSAAILLMDGMRFDLWRCLVRPMMEAQYDIEESFGFACLPSETNVSRRAFFAGKAPRAIPSGPEHHLIGECINAFHQTSADFESVPKRPGMAYSVQSKDRKTYVGVFDFADSLAHEIDWQPHILQRALKSLLREIKAVLIEHAKGTSVFIAADHGHILQVSGSPVYIPDSDQVGYRSAYVEKRVVGPDAMHVFQIKAETLGHDQPGWYVFPRPGFYLRPAAAYRGRPGAGYRHGGISVSEVFVPLVSLTHHAAATRVVVTPSLVGTATVGQLCEIRVAVSADGVVASPVRVRADTSEVDGAVASGITSTPTVLVLRFVPVSPGRRKIRFAAVLGGGEEQEVGGGTIEVTVTAAAVKEDPAVTKLKRLFGDV